MLAYHPAYSYDVRGGPHKNVVVFVKKRQELCLFFWGYFNAEADGSVWYSRVQCNFLEITFGFDGFF
jgi:hypothetical protein